MNNENIPERSAYVTVCFGVTYVCVAI